MPSDDTVQSTLDTTEKQTPVKSQSEYIHARRRPQDAALMEKAERQRLTQLLTCHTLTPFLLFVYTEP